MFISPIMSIHIINLQWPLIREREREIKVTGHSIFESVKGFRGLPLSQ